MKSIGRQKKKAEEQPTCTVSTWDIYKSLLFYMQAMFLEHYWIWQIILRATSCIVEQVIFIKGCWLPEVHVRIDLPRDF